MIYNFILENVILPLGDFALGTYYIKGLKKWRKIQKLSESQLKDLQKSNLQKVLEHCSKNVPYYSHLNIPSDENPYVWLKKFPLLYKSTIKENINNIIFGDRSKMVIERSSGSSGIHGEVYLTKEEHSASQAIQTLWWEWAGYKFGNTIMQTGINPNRGFVKSMKDKILCTDYVAAFGISEEQMKNKLYGLQKKPKDHFAGYASSLYVFAQVAKRNNIKGVKFKSVFSWGDKLFPHYRKLIEEVFETKVYDSYGCTEGLMMAAQMDHNSYYTMSPHVYIELLDKDGNEVKPGELGYVVVTRLDAFAMPLIRYYLGDLAVQGERTPNDSYELGFPLIDKIIGRDTDIIRTASGKYMVVHSFTGIFEHIPEVKQFRVIQRNLNEIEIEVIPDQGFSEAVYRKVEKIIHDALQEPFGINFKVVDFIPSTPSGKPQIIQSFIKE